MLRKIKRTVLVFILGFILIVTIHNVPKKLTKDDKTVFSKDLFLSQIDKDKIAQDFQYQIEIIRALQKITLEKINRGNGVPFNHSREPKHLLKYGEGECYDRSRFMEKAFNFIGLKTRHLSIYKNKKSTFSLLLQTDIPSHATLEVKTTKGWMLVDSNFDWIALSDDNSTISHKEITSTTKFLTNPPEIVQPFYQHNTTSIYGLYSRHGRFYKPFNPIPDYNLRELLFNLQ